MHPLQGASFLRTPLQGGILKPPALRVVGDSSIAANIDRAPKLREPLNGLAACAASWGV
jgi:hypothetical protein